MELNLYKEIRAIDACKELKILKVKVLFKFLGTMSFSAHSKER
jgi:hypothetical protein